MKLTAIYRSLRTAAIESGNDQRHDLRNNARITVRVRGNVEMVTFARPHKPVGDVEEATFKKHCSVPPNAERIPATGQQVRKERFRDWHLVTYRWHLDGVQQSLLDEMETSA